MDELIDIVDQNGVPTGETIMKFEAHRLGLWHASVHVWLFTENGEVLIQKRVANKDTFPNKWDVSVAGHIGAGETAIYSAQRELFEELGISIDTNELIKTGFFTSDIQHSQKLIDREFHHIYIVQFNKNIEAMVLQKEEVAAVQFISISDFKKEISTQNYKDNFVPYTHEYYKMVFDAIEFQLG